MVIFGLWISCDVAPLIASSTALFSFVLFFFFFHSTVYIALTTDNLKTFKHRIAQPIRKQSGFCMKLNSMMQTSEIFHYIIVIYRKKKCWWFTTTAEPYLNKFNESFLIGWWSIVTPYWKFPVNIQSIHGIVDQKFCYIINKISC